MKRSFAFPMALVAGLAIAAACSDGTAPETAVTSEIRQLQGDLFAAWNAGDAQTLEGMYAENAVVVTGVGGSSQGREAIIGELLPQLVSEGFQVRPRSFVAIGPARGFGTVAEGGPDTVLVAATADFSTNWGEGFLLTVLTLNAKTMKVIQQRDFALVR